MKSNTASESRPRGPAFRFQGDGVASINMLSIGALSDFSIPAAQSMDESASGAKRPFDEYAIYVVHGTKQRRPIVRHVIGGALHTSRKRSRENLQGSPRHCRHSGNVIPCSHRIATISA
jgi:hypothetical protein